LKNGILDQKIINLDFSATIIAEIYEKKDNTSSASIKNSQLTLFFKKKIRNKQQVIHLMIIIIKT
jgi:hypothetical protein